MAAANTTSKNAMKKRIFPAMVFTVMINLLITGCIGLNRPPRPVIRYAINYNAAGPVFPKQLPAMVKVERFSSAPYYMTPQMIYASGLFERDAYPYHQWFAPPAEMIAYALVKDLKAARGFTAIVLPGERLPATHVLTGSITEFYEENSIAERQAMLGISIILSTESRINTARQILLEKRYTAKAVCKAAGAVGFAAGMNSAMQSLSETIIQDIYAVISAQPQQD